MRKRKHSTKKRRSGCPGDQIQIDVHHATFLVEPRPPQELLGPLLEYTQRVFEEGSPLGYQERVENVAMWDLDLQNRLAVLTGLVPQIVETLRKHGYRVIVTDHRRFGQRFDVDEAFLAKLDPDTQAMLEAVRREPLGRIEAPGFNAAVEAMGLICQMYSKASVLIPVDTRTRAKDIWWKLSELADFPVRLKGQKLWPENRVRCMVCTYTPLNACKSGLWDIVLLPHPTSATQDVASQALLRLLREKTRVYGFIPPHQVQGRRSKLRLEGMCGGVIHYCDPPRVGVQVLRLTTPSYPAIGDCSALEFKRRAYWTNDRRNDFIAAVARAFAQQDTAKLRKYGVPFDGDNPAVRNGEFAALVVLVESTEHGRELQRRLPGWGFMNAVPRSGDGRTESAAGQMEPCGQIMTSARAAKKGLAADVVIQAGGAKSMAPLRHLPARTTEQGEDDAILVVDFDDRYDERAAQDAAWRHTQYEKRGWLVPLRADQHCPNLTVSLWLTRPPNRDGIAAESVEGRQAPVFAVFGSTRFQVTLDSF